MDGGGYNEAGGSGEAEQAYCRRTFGRLARLENVSGSDASDIASGMCTLEMYSSMSRSCHLNHMIVMSRTFEDNQTSHCRFFEASS